MTAFDYRAAFALGHSYARYVTDCLVDVGVHADLQPLEYAKDEADRRRKVNWLNLDKLCEAIKIGGATHLIINKRDILKEVGQFKAYHEGKLIEFETFGKLQDFIDFVCYNSSDLLEYIYFSGNPETIEGFEV